ncbi:MAG: hypothetical protein K2X45_16540 [Phreatobacter sp.]|jgi:hypothetical protein|nr:hypothetical protein [Phreatobacter sp.]
MSRRPLSPITLALTIGALVTLLAPTAPAAANPFWTGWFNTERPVVYRPIVTPRTSYFAPASTAEVLPAPHHRHHRHGRHHRLPH